MRNPLTLFATIVALTLFSNACDDSEGGSPRSFTAVGNAGTHAIDFEAPSSTVVELDRPLGTMQMVRIYNFPRDSQPLSPLPEGIFFFMFEPNVPATDGRIDSIQPGTYTDFGNDNALTIGGVGALAFSPEGSEFVIDAFDPNAMTISFHYTAAVMGWSDEAVHKKIDDLVEGQITGSYSGPFVMFD